MRPLVVVVGQAAGEAVEDIRWAELVAMWVRGLPLPFPIRIRRGRGPSDGGRWWVVSELSNNGPAGVTPQMRIRGSSGAAGRAVGGG